MDQAALQLLGPLSQFHNPGFSCPHLFVYPEAWWRWGICSCGARPLVTACPTRVDGEPEPFLSEVGRGSGSADPGNAEPLQGG